MVRSMDVVLMSVVYVVQQVNVSSFSHSTECISNIFPSRDHHIPALFKNLSIFCVHILSNAIFLKCSSQLQDIATLTENVKAQAMNTLDKAQKKKELFEKSNKKLKDFIQTIRDFLTGWCFIRLLSVKWHDNVIRMSLLHLLWVTGYSYISAKWSLFNHTCSGVIESIDVAICCFQRKEQIQRA